MFGVTKFDNSSQSRITYVTQDHIKGKSNDDVESLRIVGQHLINFPTGIDQFFPNLKEMIASISKIQVITKECFKGLSDLLYVDFSGNQITTLGDDLFTYTSNLVSIDFSKNHIKSIGKNTLTSLKNLTSLNFDGKDNKCSGTGKYRERVEKLIHKFTASCNFETANEKHLENFTKLHRPALYLIVFCMTVMKFWVS